MQHCAIYKSKIKKYIKLKNLIKMAKSALQFAIHFAQHLLHVYKLISSELLCLFFPPIKRIFNLHLSVADDEQRVPKVGCVKIFGIFLLFGNVKYAM